MKTIRSENHQLGSYEKNKVSLSCFDDKRHAQDEFACFRISETWRKHATHVSVMFMSAETWKFNSTRFHHVSGTEMTSHVSVIFKRADFRRCSFPSRFCKRICSCLLHLWKHKREMVLWTTIMTAWNSEYKEVSWTRIHSVYGEVYWRLRTSMYKDWVMISKRYIPYSFVNGALHITVLKV